MATFPSKVNYATGDVLTATNMNEIGQAINLLDGAQYAAGKNKIINGDFNINQRAFTTTTTANTYGFDRWIISLSGATGTYSAQTFTAGTAPVAGYESKNFARVAITTGNDYCKLDQKIESVRTLAGQTATVSFWAKGTNPTTLGSLNVTIVQNFGSGGSPSATVIQNFGSFTLTANWTRYSITNTVPSISGKTLGTSDDNISFGFGQGANASTDAWTLDIWGVQVEEADTASPFQTATGTIQGELAACQRYYWRSTAGSNFQSFASGFSRSTTSAYFNVNNPVSMRIAPTSIDSSTLAASNGAGSGIATTAVILTQTGALSSLVEATVASGLTIGQGSVLLANNSASAYIALNAEL
jgi:hypothetical protein